MQAVQQGGEARLFCQSRVPLGAGGAETAARGAGEPGEKSVTVRLGGPTCLAGDVVGDYSFDAPLTEGDRLLFGDMAIYTTCKNNTFNGMPLPPIWTLTEDGTCRELVRFGYNDFKMRLGHRA